MKDIYGFLTFEIEIISKTDVCEHTTSILNDNNPSDLFQAQSYPKK